MADFSLEHLKNHHTLSQLSEIYYQNTGMVVSFHEAGRDGAVSFYPQEQRSDYCRIVQSTPAGWEQCLECDRRGLEAARRKGSFHIYPCHAGLVDVAIPLDCKGVEMGSMYTGQVLLEEPNLQRALDLYGRLQPPGIPFERFAEAYTQVKVVEKSRLLFYARLLHLMANYIILAENEIHLQKSLMQKDRELHRREVERMQLEQTLKDLSISVLESGQRRRTGGGNGGTGVEPPGVEGGGTVILRAQRFIRVNHGRELMLEDVARAVFLSPNYFSSLFKKVTGCSFRTYLSRQRIEAAQELLAGTDLPIKEIVCRAGFRDYNYFNRTFRRLTGLAPARYRLLNREGILDES